MMSPEHWQLHFTALVHPEPQGSSKAMLRGGKVRVFSANPKLKRFRNQVAASVIARLAELNVTLPVTAKHVPVVMTMNFYFERPKSAPKSRTAMVVTPDLDKLVRGCTDALTKVLYHDDAQIVEYRVRKDYGTPERVEIGIGVQNV